jgi:hypothetical protein
MWKRVLWTDEASFTIGGFGVVYVQGGQVESMICLVLLQSFEAIQAGWLMALFQVLHKDHFRSLRRNGVRLQHRYMQNVSFLLSLSI